MDEIADISIGTETEEGITVAVEAIEFEEIRGEEIKRRTYNSVQISREELTQLIEQGKRVLEREELVVDGKTKITDIKREDGSITGLYIEPYVFPDHIELSEDSSIITDSYEIGANTSGETSLKSNLTHNIKQIEGKAFTLVSDSEKVNLSYTCRLTDWEFDEDGEVENISVPDVPYDQGHFYLEPGTYRIWEENYFNVKQ